MPHAKRKAPPSARKGYVLNEQVGFLLRVAMQRHTAIFTSRMVEELTQTQFAIKGVVDRLRARGLVATAGDANDRRRRAVTLTLAGRRVTEAAIVVAAQITAQTLAPLSPAEQRAVVRLLKKLG
jgi:DNA-binding MarR family transcriptional regulator